MYIRSLDTGSDFSISREFSYPLHYWVLAFLQKFRSKARNANETSDRNDQGHNIIILLEVDDAGLATLKI